MMVTEIISSIARDTPSVRTFTQPAPNLDDLRTHNERRLQLPAPVKRNLPRFFCDTECAQCDSGAGTLQRLRLCVLRSGSGDVSDLLICVRQEGVCFGISRLGGY